MTQLAKVVAITMAPKFVDTHGRRGKRGTTYFPQAPGELGFMPLKAAEAAQDAGDVYLARDSDAPRFWSQHRHPKNPETPPASSHSPEPPRPPSEQESELPSKHEPSEAAEAVEPKKRTYASFKKTRQVRRAQKET